MGEHGETIDALAGQQDHAAAIAAVAAIRPTQGDVFFPPEADATVAPLAGLKRNDQLVNKHGFFIVKSKAF